MKITVLMCLLLTSNLVFNTVIASVTVVVNKEQYEFTHEPRLVEVLAPIANQGKWYWPGSALYRADDIQLEKKRESLLENILTLSKRYVTVQPITALSLEQLRATISSWSLARRLPVKVDYDLARIVASANPQLPHGKYILKLTPRMNTVQLFGAVNKTSNVPHLAHADASEYITRQTLTNLANKDIVMVIQADGREITIPVAYWNKNHQEVMPGSQIFVPFKESLFHPEFALINQQIMTLALNRVR
ncbi:MAG: asparagine N-glycosylation enzyme membrane subunit Stt3 [Colwellia sp.]|jgi:asparagine N-glycosylation enzyme membrane subunit Stt3